MGILDSLPEQEKMIEQVATTMSVENMPLSRDCYKNLRAMASGEKTREQITQEITEKYKKRKESLLWHTQNNVKKRYKNIEIF